MLQLPNTWICSLQFAVCTGRCEISCVQCALCSFLRQCSVCIPNMCRCPSHRSLWRVICNLHIYSISAVRCEFGSVPLTSDSIATFTPCTICIQVTQWHKMFRRFTRHSGRSLYWDIYTPTYRNHRGRKNWPNDDNPNLLIRSHCGEREFNTPPRSSQRGTQSLPSAPVNQIWKKRRPWR